MTDERPTHLDLFSGIGGFALAAKWAGFRTIGFCEIDKYCQRVLAKNFLANTPWDLRAKQTQSWTNSQRAWPCCYSDIRELDGRELAGVDLITGGFPCQPFSCAGKRRCAADDRHLWSQMLRVIAEARPAWVVGENVTGIIGMELDSVLSDLESEGYATRSFVIPACGVDARHRRNRVWIVANCNEQGSQGRNGGSVRERASERITGQGDSSVADAKEARRRQEYQNAGGSCQGTFTSKEWRGLADSNGESAKRPAISRREYCEWLAEPDVGRVAHGIPARVDRLRGLGNAIVPQVAFQILKAIRYQCVHS